MNQQNEIQLDSYFKNFEDLNKLEFNLKNFKDKCFDIFKMVFDKEDKEDKDNKEDINKVKITKF